MIQLPKLRRTSRDEEWASLGELAGLWLQAQQHNGVLPIPFLGTTWAARGVAYWWRRIGATLMVTVLTLGSAGVLTAGFTFACLHKEGPVAAALYAATSLPGIRTGLRLVRRLPIDDSRRRPHLAFVGGVGALILAPYCLGVCLTVIVCMLGRDFLGERRARELTEEWRTEGPPIGRKKRRRRP